MDVKVRFFASLRDKVGRADDKVSFDQDEVTVADVWGQVTDMPLSESILVAVNMEYTDAGHKVQAGDEVAFFPPVTGG